MSDTEAVIAESAPAAEAQQDKAQEVQAAESAESAPAEQQEAESQAGEVQAESAPVAELGPKGNKEVIRLRKRAQEAELRAMYLEGLVAGGGQVLPVQGQQAVQPQMQQEQPPDPTQYTDPNAYYRDVARFEAREAIREEARQAQHFAQQQEVRQAQQQYAQTVDTILEAGETEFQDFSEVTSKKNLHLSDVMKVAILDMGDMAHRVEYFLGKNPAEAKRIAAIGSPFQQAVAMNEVLTKVRGMYTKPKTTNAPPPVKPLQGGAQPARDAASMSDDEWIAQRNKQVHGR